MPPTFNNLLPPIRAKQRTARISKEYLGRQSALEVWRKRLTVIAVLAAVVWVAYAAIGDRGQQLYSRGPVANVHAMWENNCQACHVDFTPISGRAGGIALSGWSNITDAKCQQCHAGPAHHELDETRHQLPWIVCQTEPGHITGARRPPGPLGPRTGTGHRRDLRHRVALRRGFLDLVGRRRLRYRRR